MVSPRGEPLALGLAFKAAFRAWGSLRSKGVNKPLVLSKPSCTYTFSAGRRMATLRNKPPLGTTAAKPPSKAICAFSPDTVKHPDAAMSLRFKGVILPKPLFINCTFDQARQPELPRIYAGGGLRLRPGGAQDQKRPQHPASPTPAPTLTGCLLAPQAGQRANPSGESVHKPWMYTWALAR